MWEKWPDHLSWLMLKTEIGSQGTQGRRAHKCQLQCQVCFHCYSFFDNRPKFAFQHGSLFTAQHLQGHTKHNGAIFLQKISEARERHLTQLFSRNCGRLQASLCSFPGWLALQISFLRNSKIRCFPVCLINLLQPLTALGSGMPLPEDVVKLCPKICLGSLVGFLPWTPVWISLNMDCKLLAK